MPIRMRLKIIASSSNAVKAIIRVESFNLLYVFDYFESIYNGHSDVQQNYIYVVLSKYLLCFPTIFYFMDFFYKLSFLKHCSKTLSHE